MENYYIYARKSSEAEDRQVASIESQINELQKTLVEKSKLNVLKTFTESQSAKIRGRKYFNEMIENVYEGKAKGIICWKLDRLARNAVDGGAIIDVVNRLNVKIVTPTKTYNKEDLILMYMEFGIANQFINDLSKNTKRGLKAKAERGWLPSGAKPGYENDKFAERGNKTLIKDKLRFPLIRKAWDLMLTGEPSPPQILEKLNKEWGYRTLKHKKIGGKPMSRSMIYKVFRDTFYYGEFEYPERSGNWYQGKHPPMVTEEEFNRVQMLLGDKGRKRPKTNIGYYFPFKIMKCGECSASITAQEKWQVICTACKFKFSSRNADKCTQCGLNISEMKNPVILHYVYYHCTKRKNPKCSQGSIRKEELEKQIGNILSRVQISPRFKDWAIKYLNELNKNEAKGRNDVLASLDEVYKDVIKRIDNLITLKISPQNTNGDLLSDSEFKQRKVELIKEKESIEEKSMDLGHRINKWVDSAEKLFDFACNAKERFEHGDDRTKSAIFQGLGSRLILKEKTLIVELEKPLTFIEKAIKETPMVSMMLEPNKNTMDTVKFEVLCAQNPYMLRGQDSNLEP